MINYFFSQSENTVDKAIMTQQLIIKLHAPFAFSVLYFIFHFIGIILDNGKT